MAAIRKVDGSGRIALGKQFAGRCAIIDEREPGVWIVKLGDFIPDNERWLLDPEVRAELDRAIAWAEANPPRETDLDELEKKILGHS